MTFAYIIYHLLCQRTPTSAQINSRHHILQRHLSQKVGTTNTGKDTTNVTWPLRGITGNNTRISDQSLCSWLDQKCGKRVKRRKGVGRGRSICWSSGGYISKKSNECYLLSRYSRAHILSIPQFAYLLLSSNINSPHSSANTYLQPSRNRQLTRLPPLSSTNTSRSTQQCPSTTPKRSQSPSAVMVDVENPP